jgi:hypothetical protein
MTLTGEELLVVVCLGAAALALWVFARFPTLGPRRPLGVILAIGFGWASLSVAGKLFDAVSGYGDYGVLVGVVGVILPALTLAFWVSGCALRAIRDILGTGR